MDAGCVQKDFIRVDREATFRGLELFHKDRANRLSAETRWLEENKIDLILSDSPSYPLKAGKSLGIPSLLIANFTWHDIYRAFPEADGRADALEVLREEYSSATLQFLPQCHIANDIVANKETIGFIALRGKDRRGELERFLPGRIDGKTLVFVYLGQFDSSRVRWENLENVRDCAFVTRDPLPAPTPIANLFALDERFSYPDLVASSDVVCTKAGYSTLASAFAHGKPVISCRREDFREFEAVESFLEQNQVGLIVDADPFYAGDWAEPVKKARQLTVEGKVKLDGELEVVRKVKMLLQG